ncbi:hypothetical protein [Cryptosporangium japonicum]|uniref:Uncharacterized protein n=1 Tax=Cryptosporangium japonicum TaxID=80872 RepID=A0ABN0TSK5_9ACTN
MSEQSTSTPSILRPLFWVLLTIGLIGNLAMSLLSGPMAIHTAFGALTVVSGVVLAVHYLRKR